TLVDDLAGCARREQFRGVSLKPCQRGLQSAQPGSRCEQQLPDLPLSFGQRTPTPNQRSVADAEHVGERVASDAVQGAFEQAVIDHGGVVCRTQWLLVGFTADE